MATTTTNTAPSSYGDCVAVLKNSLSFLESSVDTLGTGVADYPRLGTVLKAVRHYELIPQPTLSAAEASLRDEIGPFIALLLDRADRQLERQARRIETLKARAELNAGRLSHGPGADDDDDDVDEYDYDHDMKKKKKKKKKAGAGTGRGKSLGGEAALRARAVRQRKEALRYGVERLELEVVQKERELKLRLEKV